MGTPKIPWYPYFSKPLVYCGTTKKSMIVLLLTAFILYNQIAE
jgi:hypothetical protein